MKTSLRIFILVIFFGIITPANLFAQRVDTEVFDPGAYIDRYGYLTPETPNYIPIASPLNGSEIHALDSLSRQERNIIEEAVNPPAIGIIRDLKNPVTFDLNSIDIPTGGEISIAGGRLSRLSEDLLVFTTRVQSAKSDELRLFFAEGNFPHGVKVNLFSRDGYAFNQPELYGTLDEYGFYTTTTFADHITLQVVIPLNQIDKNLYFTISKVIHADNRYIPEEDPVRSCFLDANCSDANSYTHITSIREATARLYFPSEGKYGYCSGGLLNDSRSEDWQPFLLTANHCFDTQTSAAGLEARFNYWSTYCNSGVVNPSHIIINGANLISTNSQTDFTLVLLKHQSSNYYLGWDAGSVSNNTTMHSTHHPGATLMKYQRMTHKTSPSHSCGGFSLSDFYYTLTTYGQEEPGSSGGLIVDPFGRVRGQLYGWCYEAGADRCDYDTYNNMWGRFDKSYSINNLGYWLYNGGSSVAISTNPGSSYNYGTENVGSYDDHIFTVNNSGSRPNYLNLEAGNAYISGTHASQFTIIGATFMYLAPGESGTFTVRFSPNSPGKKTATLNIPHNANNYGSPKQITLTGYGNPCSDIISLGGGGSQNTKTFSKSGEGAWTSNFCGYDCDGNEQIYSFTAPQTGTYSINITNTNSTWVDYFWKSGSCSSGSWNCINDVYSPSIQGTMNWTAGTTYYILLDAENTSLATHSFYVFLDPCSNIITINGTGSGYSKTYAGGGYGSWFTSEVSACGYNCEGQEQIYSFLAHRTGNYAIQVSAAGNWVDYMWKDGTCSDADWQCIDDVYNTGLYGEMYWTAGEVYLLLLDDEDNTTSNHTFHIELTEALGTWTGLVNTNWHNAANWSFNTVPTSAIDVSIPDNVPHQPSITISNAYCNTLFVEDGATLTLGARSLIANGDINCEGSVILDQEDAVFTVMGDIYWYDGSYLEVNDYNTFINVYGLWQTDAGSNIAPTTGFVDFKGTSTAYIRNYEESSSFYNLRVYKTDEAYLGLSAFCTQPVVVENLLFITSGAILNSYTDQNLILRGTLNYYGSFDFTLNFNTSTFVFDGNVQGFNSYGVGSGLFNNVLFSSATSTTANNDIQVAENLSIDQGTFNAGSYTISLGGDWNNMVGPDAFVEGESTVQVVGEFMQYVTTENFNILEMNKPNGDFTIRYGDNVECQSLKWLSTNNGEIYVIEGTFTAWDLFESGIYGQYFLINPNSTVNLYQDASQWIDLNAEIRIDDGTMNVFGGSGVSFWPYSANAELNMSNGTLNFMDNGIYLNGNSSFDFSVNITDGTIQTNGSFTGFGDDFQPAGGTCELTGGSDAYVGIDGAGYFYDLVINKVTPSENVISYQAKPSKGQVNAPEREQPLVPDSRVNAASAWSDFSISNNLIIENGTLDVNQYHVVVGDHLPIYGTLAMTDPAGNLTAAFIEWFAGSEANVTAGTFHADLWRFNEGTNAMIDPGNTAYVYSLFYPLDDDAEFGNLIAISGSKLLDDPESRAYYPSRVSGNLTIQDGSDWYFNQAGAGLLVNGNATIEEGSSLTFNTSDFVVDGFLSLEGELNINYEATALAHGDITWPETGSLNIDNGEVIFDAPNHPDKGWEYINGHFTLGEGLFEITHNSTNFGATATTSISGGIIRTGGAFGAITAGAFEPTGGTVELTGNTPDLSIYCYGGNYFYNLLINRGSGFYCYLMNSDVLDVKNDLTILSGALNSGASNIFIGGNWTNNVGPDGFVENTNEVWFYGESFSHIYTDETFYDLYIFDYLTDGRPTSDSKIVDETYIEDGVNVHVLNDCRFLGGSLNMGNNSVLDVDNNFIFNGGQCIVPDGTPAEIYAGGHYENFNPGQAFFPGNSTFTFDGIADQTITTDYITVYFYNLNIDNPGNFVKFYLNTHVYGDVHVINGTYVNTGIFDHNNTFEGDINVEPAGGFLPKGVINFEGNKNTVFSDQSTITSYIWGDLYIDKAADNLEVLLNSDLIILNNYSIDVLTGEVDLNGHTLRCTNNVTIHDGGKLKLDAGANLEVGDAATLAVQSGGTLEVIGVNGNPATVKAWSAINGHRYYFDVNSGGTISAKYGMFRHMETPHGLNVKDGAIIDPDNNFENCTFRNGESGGGSSYLTINNNQNLTISGVSFPDADCDYNVGKGLNQGHITFEDFSGDFAGEYFDYDPNNLIDWYEPNLEASPMVLDVGATAGSVTFDVISTLNWTATESTGWFSIAPAFGTGNATITVNYSENISVAPRSGEITLSAPEVPDVVVTVNQEGADYIISISPSNRNVSSAAGTTTFSVEANPGWTWDVTETVPWLSVSPMNGSGNATLTVTYNENTTTETRVGTINLPGGVSATVTQASANIIFSVTPDEQNVGAPAGSTSFSVTSNTSWTVSESVGWFSVTPGSGSGNGGFIVNYSENTTTNPRSGSITVSATGAPDVVVMVNQDTYMIHEISVPTGWSGLSSYIMPIENSITDVMAPLSSNFIILQTLDAMFYPDGSVNTIGTWDAQSAYKIKLSAGSTLDIIGMEETNKTFAMGTGWSLMPVISNILVDAEGLFTGADVKIVKDVAGIGLYWPEYSINTIGDFIPGSAYMVNMNSGGAVTFPPNAKQDGAFEIPAMEIPESPWDFNPNGPGSHAIAVLADGYMGVMPGDVLSVFDQAGNCYGMTEIISLRDNSSVIAFANDPFTLSKNGFEKGDNMALKIYRPQNGEVFDPEVAWDLKQANAETYSVNGISVISRLKVAEVGINQTMASSIGLWPNPTHGIVNISGIENFNKIEIYNIAGRIERVLKTYNEPEKKLDLTALPAGVYQLRFSGEQSTVIKKLIRK